MAYNFGGPPQYQQPYRPPAPTFTGTPLTSPQQKLFGGVQVPALMAAMTKPKQNFLGPPQQGGGTDPFQADQSPLNDINKRYKSALSQQQDYFKNFGLQTQGGYGPGNPNPNTRIDMRVAQQYGLLGLDSNSEEFKKKMQELQASIGKFTPYGTDPFTQVQQFNGQRMPTTSSQPRSVQTPLDPRGGMTYQMPAQFQGFDVAKWEGQY